MSVSAAKLISLGGIGADAHSVGLTILRHALVSNGYDVCFLGTQNSLAEFFEIAPHVDVVMISCMDGHLQHYIADFADLCSKYPDIDPLWYVGGNLTLGDPERVIADANRAGFDRVFPKYVTVPTILAALATDLEGRPPRFPTNTPVARRQIISRNPPPSDGRLPRSDFDEQRKGVLESWPTGWRAHDLDDNARFLSRQPSFAKTHAYRPRGGLSLLLQPRSGVALPADQRTTFLALRQAGADVLSYQVDSLTRNNAYHLAADAIAESKERKTSTLNGFPMVNHGVDVLRRVISDVRMPLQTRHSTRDPRLLAEISCAGGVTGFEGGAVTYNIPYFRDYPLAQSLARWQYVDRLMGLYAEEYGVVIDREFFGTLTAVLIPPCLAIVVNLVEAILAAGQGVRSVSLGYAEQGNRSQDVAAIRVLRELGVKYLANLGYRHVQVNTVFHEYMSAFPANLDRARQLITASAATARLSSASRVIVKTPVEANDIPGIGYNREGLLLSRLGAGSASSIALDEKRISEEMAHIRTEAEQIFASIMVAGGGSLTEGVGRAFERGYLDVPFSPSNFNRGEVLTARDAEGAVRFLDTGRLQLSSEVIDFHRYKMDQRRRAELVSVQSDWQLVERDVLQVPAEGYKSWPLGD